MTTPSIDSNSFSSSSFPLQEIKTQNVLTEKSTSSTDSILKTDQISLQIPSNSSCPTSKDLDLASRTTEMSLNKNVEITVETVKPPLPLDETIVKVNQVKNKADSALKKSRAVAQKNSLPANKSKLGLQSHPRSGEVEITVTPDNPPSPAAPLDLEAIQKLVTHPKDPKQSTQSLLSDIAKALRRLDPSHQVVIESEFVKTNGAYTADTFAIPDEVGKTYYKAKVIYIVRVEGKDSVVIPPLTREVFTTATVPEHAMLAAAKFKETVIQLALASSDPQYKTQGWGLSFPTDVEHQKKVMKQRSFEFNFSYDAAGKPLSLLSIHAGSKEGIALTLKPNPAPSQHEYMLDLETNQVTRIVKGARPAQSLQTLVYYATEEEVVLNVPYGLKDNLYESLEASSKAIDEQIKDIKELIQKKEAELAQARLIFIKEPYTKLFGAKDTLTKPIETYFNNREAVSHPTQALNPSKPLSQHVQTYLKLKNYSDQVTGEQEAELQFLTEMMTRLAKDPALLMTESEQTKLRAIIQQCSEDERTKFVVKDKGFNGDALIQVIRAKQVDNKKQIQDNIAEFEKEITKEQESFNQNLSQLQRLNGELDKQLRQLNQGRIKAQANSNSIKAQALLKAFSAVELKKLEDKVTANKQLIKELLERRQAIETRPSTSHPHLTAATSTKEVVKPAIAVTKAGEVSKKEVLDARVDDVP